jgi:nitrogenase molybdenum-iron protein NifN
VGVLTTCLAETIGEDIKRITEELKLEDEEVKDVKLIPISTPGYAGTQFEGYNKALLALVEDLSKNITPIDKINVICSSMNPGDMRSIKIMLEDFGIDYILFPDVSETLDSPYKQNYTRIPTGGTKVKDIEAMAGARATIEIGLTIEDKYSPGVYLKEKYGVPLYKSPMPIGLENTDTFLDILSKISNKTIPQKYSLQRGRFLDALIDAHKYNGEARVAIYGEPEFCIALSQVCMEAGISVAIVAMGAVNDRAKDIISSCSKRINQKPVIIDDTDFQTIEKYALEFKVNVMLGNSDGRRIEEKYDIKLIRLGFPVHDRIGAHRKVTIGYDAAIELIEAIANSILENKERGYRKEMYNKYFVEDIKSKSVEISSDETVLPSTIDINTKTAQHPCYNHGAHQYARMHIPIAPKCNISCNYCSRKYDCANESRPGVTSEVLTPEQALAKLKEVKEKVPNLTVVGIAGPGDALANFEETKKSLQLIRKEFPEITFCLSTNGLMLPFYAEELINLGVTHVTITMNTLDAKIGAKLYKHITYLGNTLTGEEGIAILIQNQLSGLKYLTSRGVVCKVNIVMVKGVNDYAIPDVVKKVKECGAFMTNIMQMIPAPGSVFEKMPLVSQVELNDMRKKCEIDLKQMYHCRQCRADAIGTLAEDRSIEFRCSGSCSSDDKKKEPVLIELVPQIKNRVNDFEVDKNNSLAYKIAVATKSGLNIDQHFGHAEEFYIYDYKDGSADLIEKRSVNKYCTGSDECDEHTDKIQKIMTTIKDCNAVVVMRAGNEPVRKLEKNGIKVFQMYEGIQKGIQRVVEMLQAI